jgi:hypothetical protein
MAASRSRGWIVGKRRAGNAAVEARSVYMSVTFLVGIGVVIALILLVSLLILVLSSRDDNERRWRD